MHEVVISGYTEDLCTLADGVDVMRLADDGEMGSGRSAWITR